MFIEPLSIFSLAKVLKAVSLVLLSVVSGDHDLEGGEDLLAVGDGDVGALGGVVRGVDRG